MSDPIFLSDDVPFTLSCINCDYESPETYAEATGDGLLLLAIELGCFDFRDDFFQVGHLFLQISILLNLRRQLLLGVSRIEIEIADDNECADSRQNDSQALNVRSRNISGGNLWVGKIRRFLHRWRSFPEMRVRVIRGVSDGVVSDVFQFACSTIRLTDWALKLAVEWCWVMDCWVWCSPRLDWSPKNWWQRPAER